MRRGRGEGDEVAPRRRLAARQVNLEHAERGGFVKHARAPFGDIELAPRLVQHEGIGAVAAL